MAAVSQVQTVAPDIHEAIRLQLDDVTRQHNVRILLAIESGSRAWGFPSPDSDYDCRFVYVRRRQDYLSLRPRRDVIELPMNATFDINGWDIGKALKLLAKGNAVALEWLMSPVLYQCIPSFREDMQALAQAIAPRNRVMRHYLHLAEFHRKRFFSDPQAVPLKKIFYVLRPALVLCWMMKNPEITIPPMAFDDLLHGQDLAPDLLHDITALITAKAAAREMGTGPVPMSIRGFIEEQLSLAALVPPRSIGDEQYDADAMIDAFFLAALDKWAPH